MVNAKYSNSYVSNILTPNKYNEENSEISLKRGFCTRMEQYNVAYKGYNPDHIEDIYELVNRWTKDDQVPESYDDAINIIKNYMQLRRSKFDRNVDHPFLFDQSYAHTHKLFLEKMFKTCKPSSGNKFFLNFRCNI